MTAPAHPRTPHAPGSPVPHAPAPHVPSAPHTPPAPPPAPGAPPPPGAPPLSPPGGPPPPGSPPPGVPPLQLPPAHPPALLAADQATDLLDRVVYEQVLECIDLDELFQLEQSLAFTASSLPGVSHARSTELAKSLLERAFRRLPDDIRNYLSAVEALACNGCELCEEEAREEARDARSSRSSSRRSIRLKS